MFYSRPLGVSVLAAGAGFTAACGECTAFLARTDGTLNNTHKQAYSDLICGLKSDGVLTKLDALYIFATNNRTNALLNLVQNAFNPTEHGTVSFSADHGYTGDGSTFFLDTGFTPSTAGGNFTLNAASLGFYDLTNRNPFASTLEIGVHFGGVNNDQAIAGAGVSNQATCSVNTTGAASQAGGHATNCFIAASRTTSSLQTLYRNGSSIATDATASGALASGGSIYICANNNFSGGSLFSSDQLSAAFLGGGLTGTDVSNLSIRLNNYMTVFGINQY